MNARTQKKSKFNFDSYRDEVLDEAEEAVVDEIGSNIPAPAVIGDVSSSRVIDDHANKITDEAENVPVSRGIREGRKTVKYVTITEVDPETHAVKYKRVVKENRARQLCVLLPQSVYDEVKRRTSANGISVNQFINDAIMAQLQQD